MGIYIPNVEMPREKSLWLCIRTDGTVYNIKPVGTAHTVGTAVPLPEGHGRLGDLDRLFEVMGQDVDRWIVDEVSMIETDDVLDAIQNAPTIIEADLEWKMKNCCCFSNTDQAEGGGGRTLCAPTEGEENDG